MPHPTMSTGTDHRHQCPAFLQTSVDEPTMCTWTNLDYNSWSWTGHYNVTFSWGLLYIVWLYVAIDQAARFDNGMFSSMLFITQWVFALQLPWTMYLRSAIADRGWQTCWCCMDRSDEHIWPGPDMISMSFVTSPVHHMHLTYIEGSW